MAPSCSTAGPDGPRLPQEGYPARVLVLLDTVESRRARGRVVAHPAEGAPDHHHLAGEEPMHTLPRLAQDVLLPRRTGSAPRIAFYSHDTQGLGHIRRNSLLAAAMVAAHPDVNV